MKGSSNFNQSNFFTGGSENMLQKRSAVESLVEDTCKGLMCNLHIFSTQHISKLFSFEVICFITPISLDSISIK